MKKYKITHLRNIFEYAEIQTINIEHLNFDIVDKKDLQYKGKRRKKEAVEGELDLFAYYKNVIWLIEWTTESGFNTQDFDTFKTKIELLNENRELLEKFIEKIKRKFELNLNINVKKIKLIGLYVNPLFTEIQAKTLEKRIPRRDKALIYIWDRDTFEYFKTVCGVIRRFSKYELFSYFDISPEFVFTKEELEAEKSSTPYEAIEIENGVFGYPTYTFKIEPILLLKRCYVLRNEGWRSDSFQRMIIPKKLLNIREYILTTKNTSFANNIIISPSPDVDPDDIIKRSKNNKIEIFLPLSFGSFCIIDGQHRLLAFTQDFYEEIKNNNDEKKKDEELKKLANESEIIVTLVKFFGSRDEILRKQTMLFKDINSTQTKVKTDFIYNLQEIINPIHPQSIANKVIKYLNSLEDGIFKDKFEIKSLPSYRGRIKRSSIVKWGLSELVDIEKPFLFQIYKSGKSELVDIDDDYIKFCGDKINKYFKCVKEVFEKRYKEHIWDNWRKTGYMLLSTSSIVGFLRLYRHFIVSKIITDEKKIKQYLKAIRVNFKKDRYIYVSSQWAKLEEKMFEDIRKKHKDFGDENLIRR